MFMNFLFILSILGVVSSCPPVEEIAPCICKPFLHTPVMTCQGLMNPDELVGPIQATALRGSVVEALAIEHSSLLYIPSSIFRFTKIQRIRLLNSEVMSLSDSDYAFMGLEDTLTELRAKEAHYVTQWDWQQLRNLQKLELIDVNDIELESISSPFPELKSLRFLGIINADISFIIDYSFRSLENLMVLSMKKNDISELKRNMFPDPAMNLISLDFSENELLSLPEDFFENMPRLEDVKLNRNKFVTLNEKTFAWALKYVKEIAMIGNEFRCDCRIRWIAEIRLPNILNAACSSPEPLAGTALRDVDQKLLFC